MVSELRNNPEIREIKKEVLILVLVGYGLWDAVLKQWKLQLELVLILVLVGYGLWAFGEKLPDTEAH